MRSRLIPIFTVLTSVVIPLVAGCTSGSSSGGTMATPGHATPTVPVVACQTTRGVPHSGKARYGRELALAPATNFGGAQVTFYTDNARQLTPVLGPSGWKCRARVGADGGSGVFILPPGSSALGGAAVVTQEEPACQGCVYSLACAYIPQAKRELGAGLGPCRSNGAIRAASHSEFRAKNGFSQIVQLAATHAPPYISGVLLYAWKRQHGAAAALLTCQLPSGEENLCALIVTDFEARNAKSY